MDEQDLIRQAMAALGRRRSTAKTEAARRNAKLPRKRIAALHKPTTQAIENKSSDRIKTCPACRGRGILLSKIESGSWIDLPCPHCSQANENKANKILQKNT